MKKKMVSLLTKQKVARVKNQMIGFTVGWWIGIHLGWDFHLSDRAMVGMGWGLIVLTTCLFCLERILTRRIQEE